MFVGTTGIDRVVRRSCEVMAEHDTFDIAQYGAIPLAIIQKYLNFHYSVSLDLFGSEISTNAANYFTTGLKGRWAEEAQGDDHLLGSSVVEIEHLTEGGQITSREVSALTALNHTLRNEYIADCQNGVTRWNRVLEEFGVDFRLSLPATSFNRKVGIFSAIETTPNGQIISAEAFEAAKENYLPSDGDKAFVRSLMRPVYETGKIASWIAPPIKGINSQPFDYEYVHLA